MAKAAKRTRPSRSSVKLHQPIKVEVGRLRFDIKNPRYASDQISDRATDAQIISQLIVTADIAELVQSIASNGYIDIEPMVVMPLKENFIVLEGNRRLAAIKLLSDPDLAKECGFQTPAITRDVAETLLEITVYAVEKRDEARDFIGFKHINGPHRWDALAKARFAADWFISERRKGVTIESIAHRLGDRHDTVKRLVNGVFILDQAHKERIYDLGGVDKMIDA